MLHFIATYCRLCFLSKRLSKFSALQTRFIDIKYTKEGKAQAIVEQKNLFLFVKLQNIFFCAGEIFTNLVDSSVHNKIHSFPGVLRERKQNSTPKSQSAINTCCISQTISIHIPVSLPSLIQQSK